MGGQALDPGGISLLLGALAGQSRGGIQPGSVEVGLEGAHQGQCCLQSASTPVLTGTPSLLLRKYNFTSLPAAAQTYFPHYSHFCQWPPECSRTSSLNIISCFNLLPGNENSFIVLSAHYPKNMKRQGFFKLPFEYLC